LVDGGSTPTPKPKHRLPAETKWGDNDVIKGCKDELDELEEDEVEVEDEVDENKDKDMEVGRYPEGGLGSDDAKGNPCPGGASSRRRTFSSSS
jgi:hypothetical protein